MTAKIIRIFLIFSAILTLALSLPGLYRKSFETKPGKKMIYYSEISKDFIICEDFSDTLTNETDMIYYDRIGKQFSEREYMKLLPFIHTRKLSLLGELPDSVQGIKFTPDILKTTKRGMLMVADAFSFRLNPLFESASGNVRLELPDDFFRINNRGVEFLDPDANRVIPDKSKRFTDALSASGFKLPARNIYGIPSTLKSRDDGYFILDATGTLYHLLMVKGEPLCRRIETPVQVAQMKCQVPGDIYGYIYDTDNQLYILRTNYTFKKLPVPPSAGRFMLSANCFYKTFKITDSDSIRMYILDKNYDTVDYLALEADNYRKSKVAEIEQYLFPLKLMITPGYAHIIPIVYDVKHFIFLNIFLMLLLTAIKRKNHRKIRNVFNLIDILIVGVFGIFGFISVLIFPNRK